MAELDLGTAGRDFVAARLGDGKTLSQLLLGELERRGAEVVTWWPEGVATAKAFEPRWGGLPEGAGAGQLGWMRDEVVAHLAAPGAVALFENNAAMPGDPWLARLDAPLWFHGDEVYHPIGAAARPETVAAVLRDAERPWLVGALAAADVPGGDARLDVDRAPLAAVATGSDAVVVSAYDEEGYVVARLAR